MMWTVPGPPRRRSRRVLGRLLPAFKPAIPDIRVKSGISTWNPCDIRGIRDIRAILEKIYLYIYFFPDVADIPAITAIPRISRLSRGYHGFHGFHAWLAGKGPSKTQIVSPGLPPRRPGTPFSMSKKHAFSLFYVATGCSSSKPPRPTKHWQEWDETHIGALW